MFKLVCTDFRSERPGHLDSESTALEIRLGSFVDKAQNLTSFRCSYRVIYLDVVNI
jgi:hypothetical protein